MNTVPVSERANYYIAQSQHAETRRRTPGLLVATETDGCLVNCETNQQHRKQKKSFSPHFPSDASHLEPPQHTPPPPPPPPRGKLARGRRRPCMGGSLSERACRSVRRLSRTQTGRPPLERHRNTTFALDPSLAGGLRPSILWSSHSLEHKNSKQQHLLLRCRKIQTPL